MYFFLPKAELIPFLLQRKDKGRKQGFIHEWSHSLYY